MPSSSTSPEPHWNLPSHTIHKHACTCKIPSRQAVTGIKPILGHQDESWASRWVSWCSTAERSAMVATPFGSQRDWIHLQPVWLCQVDEDARQAPKRAVPLHRSFMQHDLRDIRRCGMLMRNMEPSFLTAYNSSMTPLSSGPPLTPA